MDSIAEDKMENCPSAVSFNADREDLCELTPSENLSQILRNIRKSEYATRSVVNEIEFIDYSKYKNSDIIDW